MKKDKFKKETGVPFSLYSIVEQNVRNGIYKFLEEIEKIVPREPDKKEFEKIKDLHIPTFFKGFSSCRQQVIKNLRKFMIKIQDIDKKN